MINQKIRMLAAIMFTDMVGYTALMQENEQRAKLLRDKHRNILENAVLEHKPAGQAGIRVSSHRVRFARTPFCRNEQTLRSLTTICFG